MAGSLNKVLLIGRLGADPEVKQMVNGKSVARLSLATSQSWKDKNTGEPKEATEWHRVVFFNRRAEIAREYLTKGSHVYIEGRNRTRKWQDSEGRDRYTTEIIGDELKMLGKNPNAQQGAAGNNAPSIEDGSWPTEDDIPFDDNPNSGQQ